MEMQQHLYVDALTVVDGKTFLRSATGGDRCGGIGDETGTDSTA